MSLFSVPQPQSPTITPLVVQFPELDSVTAATFSRDGKSIYAQVPAEVVDIAWIVRDWGGPLSLILIVPLFIASLVWMWRVARKPRRAGAHYCRSCNYEVGPSMGGGSALCPECGTAFASKRPLLGKSVVRRRMPALLIALLATLLTITFFLPAVRDPTLEWLAARAGVSRWLFEKANQLKVPLNGEAVTIGTLLIELDATTGERVRTIRVTRHGNAVFALPDGQSLLVNGTEDAEVIHIRDGHTSVSFDADKAPPLWFGFWQLLGYSEGGQNALLRRTVPSSGEEQIVEYSFASQRLRTIESPPMRPSFLAGTPSVGARDVQGNVRSFAFQKSFTRPGFSTPYELRIIDVKTGKRAILNLGFRTYPNAIPVFSADGSRGYIFEEQGDKVCVFDPATGKRIKTLDLLPSDADLSMQVLAEPYLLNHDRWLAICKPFFGVLIYDIERQQWLGRLALAPQDYDARPQSSPSGNRVLSILNTYQDARQVGGTDSELLIWDASSFHLTPTTPPAPPK